MGITNGLGEAEQWPHDGAEQAFVACTRRGPTDFRLIVSR